MLFTTLSTLAVVFGTAFAQSKTSITTATYNDLVYYANLNEATSLSIGSTCPNPPNGVIALSYIDTGSGFDDTNVHGVVCLLPQQHRLQFMLVHAGFNVAYSSAKSMANTALAAAFKKYPSAALIISGYSLGGAIADLQFADLIATSSYKIAAVYTYGEPRTGNQAYANFVDAKSKSTSSNGIYFRVTHANDPVPRLPPAGAPIDYVHCRTEYWEMSSSAPSASSTYHCFGQEPSDCNEKASGSNVNDHLSYAGFAGVTC
ncbi:alpha/beta-hydrolase [Pseudovirgaria hyperparasitica]|uniref:Alpha/beta-hydrolase n=1 Tax=Pseudovirgaria hyperparasitica TaxID=470096 RepID=A0A6A6WAJ1_9PEZI|nr:alpha/beta-hydrolase [Pseudovirgaria hyperparasitica]KAF2759878.1 alpha/beta-hydrolase [Pseudovirgaria hyperparasitica]